MSKKESKENNVTVGVRIRPLNEKEKREEMKICFQPNEEANHVEQLNDHGAVEDSIGFSHVFGPVETNQTIFEKIGPKLVDSAMDGFNSVLFMYGQTSSGKTFTLFGAQGTPGLIQYAMDQVNTRVNNSEDIEYLIRFSYAELYIDDIKDLFGGKDGLKIIDDETRGGPIIAGITEIPFENGKQVMTMLNSAEKNRHFSATKMNEHSSRSHVIVRLTIESRKVIAGQPCKKLRTSWAHDEKPQLVSTLNLVDLAGSENTSKSNTSGQSLTEGKAINKSLLSLGRVIAALTEGKGKAAHISYRESNLTRLLQSALGGNAKTIIITCLSPAAGNRMESISTLKFATRARLIVNAAKKNEFVGDMKTLVAKLNLQALELDKLKDQIQQYADLGYSLDGASAEHDSLKSQAVQASSNWRNLRFLMGNAPKIVKALKANGMGHIAKTIQNDVRDAVSGTKDLSEIISEHSNIINTYLPKETGLSARIGHLHMLNEAELVGSGEDIPGYEEDLRSTDGDGNQLDFGDNEELQERLENATFQFEDLRVFATHRINSLENACAEHVNREKAASKEINDMTSRIFSLEETNKKHEMTEATLLKTIEDLRAEHQNEKDQWNTSYAALQSKVNELGSSLDDKESRMLRKTHENMAKENEIEKLKTQCDQLNKDLQAAVQSRRAYEEETTRSRNDMRIQMEKLRGNMHELLRQGGEEAKVIESQNTDLQRDLDHAKDDLVVLSASKDRLEQEASHLRMEIAIMRDELKSREEKITVGGSEAAEQSHRLREMRLEITRTNAALSASNQHNDKLSREVKMLRQSLEELQVAKDREVEELTAQLEAKYNEAASRASVLQAELDSANEQISSKQAFITKLEYSFSADTARFEKKLAAQTKSNEDLQHEISSAYNQHQHALSRHVEEIKTLQRRNAELQSSLDYIDRYLGSQQYEPPYVEHDYDQQRSRGASPATTHVFRNLSGVSEFKEDRQFSGNDLGSFSSDSIQEAESKPFSNSVRYSNADSTTFNNATPANPVTPLSNRSNSALNSLFSAVESPTLPAPTTSEVRQMSSSQSRSASKLSTAANKYPFHSAMLAGDDSVGDDSSELYRSILLSMTCVTKELESSYSQYKNINDFMLSQHSSAMSVIRTDEIAIQDLEDKERHLQRQVIAAEDTIRFIRDKETRLLDQKNQTEADHRQLVTDFAVLQRAEMVASGKAATMEEQLKNLTVLLDKVHAEQRQAALDKKNMIHVHTVTSTRLEEAQDTVFSLESKVAALQQQLGVLETERNELMKRFLSMRTNTGTSTYHHSNATASPNKDASSSGNGNYSSTPTGGNQTSGSLDIDVSVYTPARYTRITGYGSSVPTIGFEKPHSPFMASVLGKQTEPLTKSSSADASHLSHTTASNTFNNSGSGALSLSDLHIDTAATPHSTNRKQQSFAASGSSQFSPRDTLNITSSNNNYNNTEYPYQIYQSQQPTTPAKRVFDSIATPPPPPPPPVSSLPSKQQSTSYKPLDLRTSSLEPPAGPAGDFLRYSLARSKAKLSGSAL